MKKQRSASPSQAMPRSAPLVAHAVDDELPVLLEQRVGLVVGELAVRLPVGLDPVEREGPQQRTDHRPGHAVAAVEHDPHRTHARGVDVPQSGLAERLGHVLVLDGAGLRDRVAGLPGGDDVAQLADARVARQGEGAALDELGAGVALRVVGGGAHQTAVEAPRADRPVEHLGADHPDVEHVGALVGDTAGVGLGHGRRGQAHVTAEPDAQLGGRRALQIGEHAGKAAPDPVREPLVHLVRIEAADVVGLEDRGVDHGAGA